MNIVIYDELLNGTITNQFEISLESDTLTVRDLITKRVSPLVRESFRVLIYK